MHATYPDMSETMMAKLKKKYEIKEGNTEVSYNNTPSNFITPDEIGYILHRATNLYHQ